MRHVILIAGTAVAGLGLLATCAPSQQPSQVSTFMRVKLDDSQKVLEGIAMEDFPLILKHAERLKLLSQEMTWQVIQTVEYRQQSEEFRRAADELMAAAQQENIDGAALAYMGITLRCVSCHKYIRQLGPR